MRECHRNIHQKYPDDVAVEHEYELGKPPLEGPHAGNFIVKGDNPFIHE